MKMISLKDYSETDRTEITNLAKESIGYDGRFRFKDKEYVARPMIYGGVGIYSFSPNKPKCQHCGDKNSKTSEKRINTENQVSFTPDEEKVFNEKVNAMVANNQTSFIFKNSIFSYYIKDGQLTFRGVPITKEDNPSP